MNIDLLAEVVQGIGMDIFKEKPKKKTVAYHLTEDIVGRVEKLAKNLKRSKSELVDQLLEWGLERYKAEVKRRK